MTLRYYLLIFLTRLKPNAPKNPAIEAKTAPRTEVDLLLFSPVCGNTFTGSATFCPL